MSLSGTVDGFGPRVRCALWAHGRWTTIDLGKCAVNVSGHGGFNVTGGVVPGKSESTVEGARLVRGNVVQQVNAS